jgi:hypothetical protein
VWASPGPSHGAECGRTQSRHALVPSLALALRKGPKAALDRDHLHPLSTPRVPIHYPSSSPWVPLECA